jgi:hypothetical protein
MDVKGGIIYLTRITEKDARSLHITIADVTTAYNDLTRTRSDYVRNELTSGDKLDTANIVTLRTISGLILHREKYTVLRCTV